MIFKLPKSSYIRSTITLGPTTIILLHTGNGIGCITLIRSQYQCDNRLTVGDIVTTGF